MLGVRLEGKTAIVTGASSGIGKEIAKRFAQEGADVVIADIKTDAAEEVADEIEETGQESLVVETNVSDSEGVDEMVEAAVSKFGRVDTLDNNAGVFVQKPFREMEEEDWDKVLDVNLKGAFLCARRVIEEM